LATAPPGGRDGHTEERGADIWVCITTRDQPPTSR